jgi:hypothetical protein
MGCYLPSAFFGYMSSLGLHCAFSQWLDKEYADVYLSLPSSFYSNQSYKNAWFFLDSRWVLRAADDITVSSECFPYTG